MLRHEKLQLMTATKRHLLVAAVVGLMGGPAPASPGSSDRPNILWLVSEDNGRFLGCYGDPLAHTPTLESNGGK